MFTRLCGFFCDYYKNLENITVSELEWLFSASEEETEVSESDDLNELDNDSQGIQ